MAEQKGRGSLDTWHVAIVPAEGPNITLKNDRTGEMREVAKNVVPHPDKVLFGVTDQAKYVFDGGVLKRPEWGPQQK